MFSIKLRSRQLDGQVITSIFSSFNFSFTGLAVQQVAPCWRNIIFLTAGFKSSINGFKCSWITCRYCHWLIRPGNVVQHPARISLIQPQIPREQQFPCLRVITILSAYFSLRYLYNLGLVLRLITLNLDSSISITSIFNKLFLEQCIIVFFFIFY